MKLNLTSSTVRQYIAVIVVNLVILTTGMSLAWPSPMIVKLSNGTDTPLSRPITEEEGSWIVSGGFLASIARMLMGYKHSKDIEVSDHYIDGVSRPTNIFYIVLLIIFCDITANFVGGYLLDKIGRKYCIILLSLPKLCTAILFIFVTEVWMLIVCRVIIGFADSFALTVVPVYATEIASKEHRGSLGTFLQIFSCLGIVITLSVGPFVSYMAMNAFFATVIAITTIPLLVLPDTPFYLYSKGREEEAIKVLSQIRETDEIIKQELEDYKSSIKEKKVAKMALFKNKTFLKSLALGFLLCGGANLVGFNAVSFYLQSILDSTKTSVKSEIASVIIGCIQLFAAFCTTFFTNKYNRKTILIASVSGMFFGMIGLGTFFTIRGPDDNIVYGFMNYLPIISLILVIYFYSAGIGSLLWLVTSELFDRPARAFGVSTSIVAALLIIFLTTKYFAQMTKVWGPAVTYYFFSAMCVLIGSLIAIFLPETKGKSFNEIQAALGGESIQMSDVDKEKQ